jgi:hypothetical protein
MRFKERESDLAISGNGVGTPVRLNLEIQQSLAEQINELAAWNVFGKVWGVLDMSLVENGKSRVYQAWKLVSAMGEG